MKKFLLAIAVICFLACNNTGDDAQDGSVPDGPPPPPALSYSVLNTYPHDTGAYTQGLIWHNGDLLEGTGWNGQSKLRLVELKTGRPKKERALDSIYFGEGITLLNGKIYQLTWQNNKMFVYDAASFKLLETKDWPFEGWGMTTDGTSLIISTGGSNVYFADPVSLKIRKQVTVTDNNGPVGNLNELELVNGVLYANVYETPYILAIDTASGKVSGRLDLSDIWRKSGAQDPHGMHLQPGYVLNGIAYDPATKRFFVTGKRWPALFEIRIN